MGCFLYVLLLILKIKYVFRFRHLKNLQASQILGGGFMELTLKFLLLLISAIISFVLIFLE